MVTFSGAGGDIAMDFLWGRYRLVRKTERDNTMTEIIRQHQLLDEILTSWRDALGKDFQAYRNHCYRVLNFYAAQVSKSPDNLNKAAIAVAFHDLGIWSHGTFDYLAPSAELARRYLQQVGKEDWITDVVAMIDNHHKVTAAGDGLAEAFRKADWTDVTLGLLSFGLKRSLLRVVQRTFPDAGFHRRLVSLSARHTLKHPFKPLPMFRW